MSPALTPAWKLDAQRPALRLVARAEAERPSLSIVVPAFDEASRIGPTLEATCAYLSQRGMSAEIIVVDDGSRDATADVVRAHARLDDRVRLLSLDRNRGKGFAVRAGVLEARGERVLFMDADHATPIEELEHLLRALDAGHDVAVGSRALATSNVTVSQSRLRKTMGRTFNVMVRALAVGGICDTQCGFKLFTRRAARALFEAATIDRFAFDVEILLLAQGRFSVAEVPVAWHHVDGSKVSPFGDALKMALDLVRLRLRLLASPRAEARPALLSALPPPMRALSVPAPLDEALVAPAE